VYLERELITMFGTKSATSARGPPRWNACNLGERSVRRVFDRSPTVIRGHPGTSRDARKLL